MVSQRLLILKVGRVKIAENLPIKCVFHLRHKYRKYNRVIRSYMPRLRLFIAKMIKLSPDSIKAEYGANRTL